MKSVFVFLMFMIMLSSLACDLNSSTGSNRQSDLFLNIDQEPNDFDLSDQSIGDAALNDQNTNDADLSDQMLPLTESALDQQRGEGIFREGCPKPGFAHARMLQGSGELKGEAVIADQGDILLMNDRVAYVIQDPTRESRTWWYYGGQIVDAVPLHQCQQADEDRLNSLGLVLGEGEITAIDQAVMRAFKGERAEIIQNGEGGGEVRVRIYGVDAPMWLVEAELMNMAIKAGRPKLKSEELGLELWVDYILAPDQQVIQIEFGASNLLNESRSLRMSALAFFGDKARSQRFAPSQLNLAGISLFTELPWLSAGNMGLALKSNQMGTAHFAGVDLFIDVGRFLRGDNLSGMQQDTLNLDESERLNSSDSTSWTLFFTVHQDGLSAATADLARLQPSPVLGRQHQVSQHEFQLQYSETESESLLNLAQMNEPKRPVAQDQARVEIWVMQTQDDLTQHSLGQVGEHWISPHSLSGTQPFDLSFPNLLKEQESYQLRIWIPGIAELRSPLFTHSDLQNGLPQEWVQVQLPPRGLIDLRVIDDQDRAIPATLRLRPLATQNEESVPHYQSHLHRELIHVIEHESFWLAPGHYEYSLSRGYQYEPIYGEIEVLSGEVTQLNLQLEHINPIFPYLAFDAHVHAGPSPDSDVLINDRLRGAAAEGIEIIAGTDHEIITDWSLSMEAALRPWVFPIIAEEATASLPEHMNIYPVPLETDHPRGDPPRWYGLGLDRFIDALYERGAQVIQLNHPRQGCNYLCLIGYDRESGELDASLNPLNFGFEQGELWDWGFNAVELLNSPRPIFMDLNQAQSTGFYEDWASFINLGHPVTAMGVSDVHGPDEVGDSLTLIKLGDPTREASVNLQELTPEAIGNAVVSGQAQVSLGAWVELEVNGVSLGEMASPISQTEQAIPSFEVDFTVRALPSVDITWIYLFVNCDLYQSWEAQHPYQVIKHQSQLTLQPDGDAWITVMAFGDDQMPTGLTQYDPRVTPRVVTNPIYLDQDADGQWTAPGGKTCIIPEGRRP